jgi:hypothetical protein
MKQLALFAPKVAPLRLEPTARDEVLTTCASCGRVVTVRRRTATGIVSEYLDKQNRCFNCSDTARK